MTTNGHTADLVHAARFTDLLALALPHAASLEEALAAVDLALAEEGVAFGLDAQGNWHGPTPPAPDWVLVGTGPQGGKVWKKRAAQQPSSQQPRPVEPGFKDIRSVLDFFKGDAVKAGEFIASKVDQHLKAGGAVTLWIDDKAVPISQVVAGMMVDARGQRWGFMPLTMGLPGKKTGVEIHPPKGGTFSLEPWPGVALAHDAVNRRTQGILNRAIIAGARLSADARRDLKAALSRRTHADVQRGLLDFVRRYRDRLASVLSASQLAALLGGAREVAAKLPLPPAGAAAAPPGPPPPGEPPRPYAVPASSDPEKVQLPLIEEGAKLLAEKGLVDRGLYDRLDTASRRKAFTVANVASRETLGKIRDALAEVVLEGADLDAFREKVLAEVEPGTFLSDGHLETIFRGAVQGAYSDGQYGLWQHPVVRGGFPYATYDAIHDDRVRDNHLALEHHGIDGSNVYRVDDPVFQTFRPPWDFNDRCGWTLLTVRDAAERGLKEAQQWLSSGVEPSPPAYVAFPPFRPPLGFERQSPLSLALSAEPLEEFDEGSSSAGLFVPAVTDVTPGPDQGPGIQPVEPEGKARHPRGRKTPRKLARRLRVRKRWRKRDDAALALDAEGNWHGPTPPGPGWVQAGTGPQGGKIWRQQQAGGQQAPAQDTPASRVRRSLAGATPRTLGQVVKMTGAPRDQVIQALGALVQSGEVVDTTVRGQVAYQLNPRHGRQAPSPAPAPGRVFTRQELLPHLEKFVADLLPEGGDHVAVADVRRRVAETLGPQNATPEAFDEAVFDLWRERGYHVVPIAAESHYTPEQLAGGIRRAKYLTGDQPGRPSGHDIFALIRVPRPAGLALEHFGSEPPGAGWRLAEPGRWVRDGD